MITNQIAFLSSTAKTPGFGLNLSSGLRDVLLMSYFPLISVVADRLLQALQPTPLVHDCGALRIRMMCVALGV